ncbi:MAG: LPS-assembly protein LptD, partial [Selenomonas sp.]|nr:LPS-assembly protein LptD [Selenomonas sp.]
MKNKGRACAAFLSLLALLPPQATAMYKANTETGADALDFIENRRRLERENMLTDEQQKLLADTQEMAENLRHPVDPTKASPMAFEGDDLTYNEETGEFVARGKVHAIQLDGHQFDAPEGPVQGNLKTNDIEIPGKAHLLQLTPGQSRVTLDGVNTVYNYRTKLGTMGE